MARNKCKTCKFGCRTSGMDICQYILIMGHSRGCEPQHCDKYIRGAKIKAPEGENIPEVQRKMREKYEVIA